MSLKDYSDDRLARELERRRAAREDKPVQLDDPDLTRLRAVCQEHVDALASGDSYEDYEHYIYEAAMKAIFGGDVFSFVNECLR